MRKYLLALLLIVTLSAPAFATVLGVNYYHETLMNSKGEHYIPRSPEGVAADMQDIKDVSNHVKLFVNPYLDNNVAWVEQVNSIAKSKGMYTVITAMVDDRKLTNENWPEYKTKVVALCQRFNGKADEFHVGDEIILHSDGMSREQIRDDVIDLMNACQEKFKGKVSYQELWWSHQVWIGYPQQIYYMMYENFDMFQGNMAELKAKHPDAAIGEWGEDQQEDSTQKDAAWQKDQIQKRWDIIKADNIPVAYLFAYREPNANGFGMIEPDGTRKPLWEVFGASSSKKSPSLTAPVTPQVVPPVTPPVTNTTVNNTGSTNSTDTPDNSTTVTPPKRRSSGGGGGSRHAARMQQLQQQEFERQVNESLASMNMRAPEDVNITNGSFFVVAEKNVSADIMVGGTNETNGTGVNQTETNSSIDVNRTVEVNRTADVTPENTAAATPLLDTPRADTADGQRNAREVPSKTAIEAPPAPPQKPLEQSGFFARIWRAIASIFS